MVVHPTNAEIAFAAVLGHAFGPNPERGVYRTTDGGKTWQQVLKKDENTGASDVAIDPNNPNIIFAGMWQARRTPWSLTSGGPGGGLYISKDGGNTWKQLQGNGLPDGIYGKVGVAVAPSDSRRVYALIEAEQGGLFRSDDGGENWTKATANRLLRQRAWYYTTLTVHPTNPNEIWAPNVPMLKSIDGGVTWEIISGFSHGDHHDMWIDPKNPKRLMASHDGGIDISLNGGETWFGPSLPLGQFYHVTADNRVPFHVAGAQQDIGTAQGPSRSLTNRGIRTAEWYTVGGGEAGHVVSDPSDPNIVYAGEYLGYISVYDHRTRQSYNISAYPENGSGHGAEDLKYRFQWTAPIAVSPHNPKVVYHGANVVFRTDDKGKTWKAISPDLTRNDKSKQEWSGGPITGDNTGVEFYCTIFAIAESPVQKGLIWAGSDDGLVHVTTDDGQNWTNVTKGMPGFPEWGTVSIIEPSRYDANTAYVVVDAHRLDNTKPYLYKTTDLGKNWKRLDSDLPQDIYLHSVREDPLKKNILYIGTERGVAYSTDGGENWKSLKLNLPTVAVHDLAVKDNSLVVGTMGHSIWIFDHLNVLREMDSAIASSQSHLFTSGDAIRWQYDSVRRDKWTGDNPSGRTLIYYWLKDTSKGDVTIEVFDSQNRLVKTFSSKPKRAIGYTDELKDEEEAAKNAAISKEKGVQTVAWNLNYEGADLIENAKIDWGDPSEGPMVPPGTYTIKLNADGKSLTAPLKVVADPRVSMSPEEYQAQTAFALEVSDAMGRVTKIVRSVRAVRNQLQSRNELLKANSKTTQLSKDSESLVEKLNAFEEKIHNPKAEVVYDILAMKGGAKLYSRLSPLYSFVVEGDTAPVQGVREVFAAQKKELEGFEAEWKQLSESSLKPLNDEARRLDVPIIVAP